MVLNHSGVEEERRTFNEYLKEKSPFPGKNTRMYNIQFLEFHRLYKIAHEAQVRIPLIWEQQMV